MKRAMWIVAALAAATLVPGVALASSWDVGTSGARHSPSEAAFVQAGHHGPSHGHGSHGFYGGHHGGYRGPVVVHPHVYIAPRAVVPYPAYPPAYSYPYPDYRMYNYYPGNSIYYRAPGFGFSFQF